MVCYNPLYNRVGFHPQHTLQEIKISHLGKRKIIFKMPFLGDMLVPCRVFPKQPVAPFFHCSKMAPAYIQRGHQPWNSSRRLPARTRSFRILQWWNSWNPWIRCACCLSCDKKIYKYLYETPMLSGSFPKWKWVLSHFVIMLCFHCFWVKVLSLKLHDFIIPNK